MLESTAKRSFHRSCLVQLDLGILRLLRDLSHPLSPALPCKGRAGEIPEVGFAGAAKPPQQTPSSRSPRPLLGAGPGVGGQHDKV
jgi:hypothetical protein